MKSRMPWLPLIGALVLLPSAARGSARDPNRLSAPLKPIRLHFADTEVSIVLSALGTRTHANIVYSSEKKREITINIAALTLEEALQNVAAVAGLEFRQAGRAWVVAAPAELRQAIRPFASSALLAPGAPPDECIKMLEASLPYLTARPAGNQILISGTEADIAQARVLLASMPPAPAVEAKENTILSVKNVSAAQIAPVLKSMFPGLNADAVGSLDKPGGSIGLTGSHAQILAARSSVAVLDVPAGAAPEATRFAVYQIKYSSAPTLSAFLANAAPGVQVIIGPESYAPSAPAFRPISGSSLGASAGGSSGAGGAGGDSAGGGGSAGASGAKGADTGRKAGDNAKTLVLKGTAGDLDGALKLLQQLDTAPLQVMVEVKVLDTSPQFAEELGIKYNFAPVTIGNVPAGTLIDPTTGLPTTTATGGFGSTIFSRLGPGVTALLSAARTRTDTKLLADPRVQVLDNEDANIFIGDTIRSQVSQASSNGTTIQVLEFPVGIILLVRPRVNSDGKITLRVHPVVSTITGFGPGNLPQSSSREVETTVMVQDGETIVIGGLIRDEYSKIVQEVPFLSRLPLVGELFRNRSTNRRRSDVMVFITPHIVKGL